MIDVHLRPPDDSDLPSARTKRLVGGLVVATWLAELGAAAMVRAQEAADAALARTQDPTTLTEAPPARFPGGVDKRALDASGPLKDLDGPGPSLPPPPTHPGPGPHHPPPRPHR